MANNKFNHHYRVAVIGENAEAELARRQYGDMDEAHLVDLGNNLKALSSMTKNSRPEIVELHLNPDELPSACEAVVAAGASMILSRPFAATIEQARTISKYARTRHTAVFVLDHMLIHPLVTQARMLISEGYIGELQHIRVKSHLAHSLQSDTIDMMVHPAFDKTTLIESLMGPVSEVFAYGNENGRMLSYRFDYPDRYGVHEALYTPEMEENNSQDHVLELTGTDGILWLRNLDFSMVESPKLRLKRKNRVTIWDGDVANDRTSVLLTARQHILAHLRTPKRSPLSLRHAIRGCAINEAVARSIESRQPVLTSAILKKADLVKI